MVLVSYFHGCSFWNISSISFFPSENYLAQGNGKILMYVSGTSGCFWHLCLWFSWPASQGALSCFLYVSMSPLSLKGSAKCRWHCYWWSTSQVHVILQQQKHKLQNQFDCHKCQFSRLLDLDLSSQWSDNREAEEIEVFVLLPLSPIAFHPPKKHNALISFSLKTCMGHKLRWFCKKQFHNF